MLRNLKTLGLALLAVLAIGSVATSAASATPQLHSESEHTILTGKQITANELQFDVGVLKCGIANFAGTIAASTVTTVTLTPKFENCLLGEEEAEFTHNGCNFTFHIGQDTEHLTGTVGIECPDEEVIEIDAPECTVTIPPQGPLQGVTFTNEGAETTRSVIFDIKINGFDYEEHGPLCANETETTNNGGYAGQVTVTGENTFQEHRGIWIE